MKAIRNTAARQGYMVHQQSPFRRHHLSELNVIWGDSVKPRDVRDLAFISLAYDSMLRESEMANVTFSMLSRSQKSGHYTGRISHIKAVMMVRMANMAGVFRCPVIPTNFW